MTFCVLRLVKQVVVFSDFLCKKTLLALLATQEVFTSRYRIYVTSTAGYCINGNQNFSARFPLSQSFGDNFVLRSKIIRPVC